MFYDFSWKKISTVVFIIFFLSGSVFFTTAIMKKLGSDFFRISLVKVKIALAKGKRIFDKREAIKNRDFKRRLNSRVRSH